MCTFVIISLNYSLYAFPSPAKVSAHTQHLVCLNRTLVRFSPLPFFFFLRQELSSHTWVRNKTTGP